MMRIATFRAYEDEIGELISDWLVKFSNQEEIVFVEQSLSNHVSEDNQLWVVVSVWYKEKVGESKIETLVEQVTVLENKLEVVDSISSGVKSLIMTSFVISLAFILIRLFA